MAAMSAASRGSTSDQAASDQQQRRRQQQQEESDNSRAPPSKNPKPVSRACVNCRRAHLACDTSRPCHRCVTLGREDTCYDVDHKKRGRPRLQRPRNAATTFESRPITPLKFSSFSMTTRSDMTRPQAAWQSIITAFLSMEICCARVSDEIQALLGYYPQELSHRPLHAFVASRSSDTLERLHRLLLDNVVRVSQQADSSFEWSLTAVPAQRTTSDKFFSTHPEVLATIANGSQTVADTLWLKRNDGSTDSFQAQFYLGGGLGADLFAPSTLTGLYVVCVLSQNADAPQQHHSATASTTSTATTHAIEEPSAAAQSLLSDSDVLLFNTNRHEVVMDQVRLVSSDSLQAPQQHHEQRMTPSSSATDVQSDIPTSTSTAMSNNNTPDRPRSNAGELPTSSPNVISAQPILLTHPSSTQSFNLTARKQPFTTTASPAGPPPQIHAAPRTSAGIKRRSITLYDQPRQSNFIGSSLRLFPSVNGYLSDFYDTSASSTATSSSSSLGASNRICLDNALSQRLFSAAMHQSTTTNTAASSHQTEEPPSPPPPPQPPAPQGNTNAFMSVDALLS